MSKGSSQSPSESTSSTPISTPMSSQSISHGYHSQPSSLSSSPVPSVNQQSNQTRGPLMYKIKQKVASHSSKVMASLTPAQASSLSTEQLTAHLTEEEKQIIKKVLLKEEQFRESNKG